MDNPNPTEDMGYAFVQRVVSQGGGIWRRQAEKDVGIDGTIEILRRDGSSGYIAVQVKSGKSYFRKNILNSIIIRLKGQLDRLSKLNIPAIIIVYDPEKDLGYWESINHFLADHPEALDTGKIRLSLHKAFCPQSIAILREDLRTIWTPRISTTEMREYLLLNQRLSVFSLMVLAQAILNGLSISDHAHRPAIQFLYESQLIERDLGADSRFKEYLPTSKGRKYAAFLLGGRYPIPAKSFLAETDITGGLAYACMNLTKHLENQGLYDPIRSRFLGRPSPDHSQSS